jgi:hypothetical protein
MPGTKSVIAPQSPPHVRDPSAREHKESRAAPRAPVLDLLRRGLTLSQLWGVVVVGAFGIIALGRRVNFVDLGYHLRAGRWMWTRARILDRDVFTFTFEGDAWLNQNWLTQLFFYKTWDVAGLEGLAAVIAGMFTAGFGLLFWICYRRTRDVRASAAAVVVAVLPSIYNTASRPQAVSWLLAAVVLLLLELARERPRLRLWIVPLTALWANMHGAFVIGLGFVAIDLVAAGWRARKSPQERRHARYLGATLAAASLAALVNPWGYRVYLYVAGIGTDATIRRSIEEWQPPALNDAAGILFFVSVGLTLLALLRAPTRFRLEDGLRILFGLALGVMAIRNGLWWTLAAAPALATMATSASSRPRPAEAPKRAHLALVGVVIAAAVLFSPWIRPQLVDENTPIAAATYLRGNDLPGDMLNSQHFGSFLEWAAPGSPTFADSRIELFPAKLWSDYRHLVDAKPGWTEVAKRYGIRHFVLDADRHGPLHAALRTSGDWARVFSDDRATIYARRAYQG